MYRLLYLILIFFLNNSCSTGNSLKVGTFELYEQGKLVGLIYRLDDYQIEKTDSTYIIAQLSWKSSNTFVVKGVEKSAEGLDTLEFLVKHQKTGKHKYDIQGTINSHVSDINYKYEATLVKVSSEIENKYLEELVRLNQNPDSQ